MTAAGKGGSDRVSHPFAGGRNVGGMDNRSEVREFLVSRRARITPDQAGLPAYGGTRRVPGLRREEVALLAGVSVDYYTRLERGNLAGVSDSVLEALSRALQLDDAEHAHLHDLAHAGNSRPRTRRRAVHQVRPSVQQTLDAISGAPAYVRNGRRDILAANRLGRALYSELFADPDDRGPNVARFTFLSPRARTFFLDWDRAASDVVATLRTEAGRTPYDRSLSDLIGELCTRSEEFSTRWAAHNVRFHRSGFKDVHHPIVGDLHLSFEAMELPADPGLSLIVYSAEVNSTTADGLSLLASWAATLDRNDRTDQPAPAEGLS
jgi:transcriptional regulator with XRE-family HTH domain